MTKFQFKGARALVTGATGGIGQEIARALADKGVELVLSGRRMDVLEPLAKELGGHAIPAELSDLDDVQRLLSEAGPLDILVANAALPSTGNVVDYTLEQIQRNLTVNLHAPILMARGAAAGMIERGHGHIVMIGSVSGKVASNESSMYNTTKFGLRGFSLAFRQDLAPAGVGMSIVEPGFVGEAGMFVESGADLPKGVRTVSPLQVAQGVIRAIEKNKAEVVVAPIELRASAAVGSTFPSLAATFQKAGGAEKLAKQMVENQRDKR